MRVSFPNLLDEKDIFKRRVLRAGEGEFSTVRAVAAALRGRRCARRRR
jgi:hypothetical protein